MIPAEFIKRIRRVALGSKRLADEILAGAYRSAFKGRGIDFEDVRPYSDGDDVRFIDWNVTARARATFVRRFREERELGVVIAVDLSASGDFGSGAQDKRAWAAEVAAVLAFSAVANGDRVGLVLFTDRVEKYLPPRKGRLQALQIIREVLYFRPRGRGTHLVRALTAVNRLQRRRGILFLLSDFLDTDYERALKGTARRHDLVPIRIKDARESTLPDVGCLVVQDVETGELAEVDTADPEVRAAYAGAAEQRTARLRQTLRSGRTELVDLTVGQPFVESLQRYFERRQRQRPT